MIIIFSIFYVLFIILSIFFFYKKKRQDIINYYYYTSVKIRFVNIHMYLKSNRESILEIFFFFSRAFDNQMFMGWLSSLFIVALSKCVFKKQEKIKKTVCKLSILEKTWLFFFKKKKRHLLARLKIYINKSMLPKKKKLTM